MLTLPADVVTPLIATLFASVDIIKVGFAFSGDLTKLRSSYPEYPCFDSVHALIDIEDMGW